MQDLVPGFMKFSTRPAWGVFLRFLGTSVIGVGLVTATLGVTWAGFTPVLWFLGGIAAFLGVICNELSQIIARLDGQNRH
ncbi:MAG TPA: hypothetical protein VMT45_13920 [Thermoanaerobaculaceae bacterium]|nr:hypothetical protein [Thermoanaerobaculaceae bacterium]